MKKRLNIFCMLIFLVMALSITPVFYVFYVSGRVVYQMMDKVGTDTAAMQRLLVDTQDEMYTPVQVIPDEEIDPFTFQIDSLLQPSSAALSLPNMLTGKDVKVELDRIGVNVHPARTWVNSLFGGLDFLALLADLAAFVLFFLLIRNVNRDEVFVWRNVKLLRFVGALLAFGFVERWAESAYTRHQMDAVLALKGYVVDVWPSFNERSVIIILLAFLVAEVFSIGIRLREEQELTI